MWWDYIIVEQFALSIVVYHARAANLLEALNVSRADSIDSNRPGRLLT